MMKAILVKYIIFWQYWVDEIFKHNWINDLKVSNKIDLVQLMFRKKPESYTKEKFSWATYISDQLGAKAFIIFDKRVFAKRIKIKKFPFKAHTNMNPIYWMNSYR